MTPTVRAATGLAAVALAALVLPPWLAIAGLLIVLSATFADAWVVRRPPPVERIAPSTLSRGATAEIVATAGAEDGRAVLLRQPPGPGLGVTERISRDQLRTPVTGLRRGRHALPGVASASLGPLGLARVHHPPGPAHELRVYPDVVTARRLVLRLRRTLAGLTSGAGLGPLGLGTELESVRDYSPSDDIRQVNWRASARLGRPMSNQYRIERDRDVISLIDCGRLGSAPLGAGSDVPTVLDAGLDASTVIALAADALGDRYGAIAFDDQLRHSLPPRHRGGATAVELLFDLAARSVDSDYQQAFARLSRSRRALVFLHVDLIDEAAASALVAAVGSLARRHAIVVVSPSDPILAELAAGPDAARAAVALDALDARAAAALAVRTAGATMLEAPAQRLAERCLDVYVSAKLRARI